MSENPAALKRPGRGRASMSLPAGTLRRLIDDALAAVRTCRVCGTTAWPWEVYREAPKANPRSTAVEYVCPAWPGCSK